MKKIVQKMMDVEEQVCNICNEPVDGDPFNKDRITMVRFLFDCSDFDAHEGCINKITREAFAPFFPKIDAEKPPHV